MFEPIGGSLDCAWITRFTGAYLCGYQTYERRMARSRVMFNDEYVRLIVGDQNTLDSAITYRGKDAPRLNELGMYQRSPMLNTLDPRTGEVVLTSPTRIHLGSPGRASTLGATWGNQVECGDICASECADFIQCAFGSDLNYAARFNKFTGDDVPWSCATGSNFSGIAIVSPDDARNVFNAGTAPYSTRETVYTRPLLYRDEMVRATSTAAGLQLTCTRLRDLAGNRDVVWSKVYAGYTLISGLSLGESESIVFFATTGGKHTLCSVTAMGDMLSSVTIDGKPAAYDGRIIPPPVIGNIAYTVDAVAGSPLKLNVNAYSLSTGKRATSTVSVNATVASASVFYITANYGRMIVQLDSSATEHLVVGIKGDRTPAITPKPLPATGYIPLTTVNLTPTYAHDAEIIAPVDIGIPDPKEIDTQATEPKYAGYFKFPTKRGARAFIEFVAPYIDDTRSDPADFKVYACADSAWVGANMRRKNRPKIGAIVGKFNIGRTTRSGKYRIAIPVTDTMNAATGENFTLVIGGTQPPHWGLSSLNWLGETVRLVVEPGDAPVVPPPPPVEPVPKFEQVIDAIDYIGRVPMGERGWFILNGTTSMECRPSDGFNYSTADNAKANAPRIDYKTAELPAGRYEISIAAKGPDMTKDSLFFQLDGGAMALIDSFPPAGSTRLVGFYDLAAGSHTITIYARECGLILQSIKVREV